MATKTFSIKTYAEKRPPQGVKKPSTEQLLKLAKSKGFNPLSKTDWYGWAGADLNAVIKKMQDDNGELQIVLSPDQCAMDFQYYNNGEDYTYYIAKYEDAKPETIFNILKNIDKVIKLVREGSRSELSSIYKLQLA